MPKVKISDEQLEKVYDMIMSQPFAEWYDGPFMDFVVGVSTHPKTKQMILEDIKCLLNN